MQSRERWLRHFTLYILHFSLCTSLLSPAFGQAEEDLEKLADRPKLKKLTAQVRNVVPRPRTGGPIPIEIELDHQGDKLLRGRLNLELSYGGQLIARVQTPEIVLSGDKRTERVTLPPVEGDQEDEQALLKISMLAESGRIDIDQQQVAIPTGFSRRFMAIGIAEPWQRSQTAGVDLTTALSLEQFRPNKDDRNLITFPARLDPTKLPGQPMEYCAYDLLVLPAEGLAQASAKPLAAITAWVRAGGSICVVTGGGLDVQHAVFLNALAADGEQRFLIDDQGRASLEGDLPEDGVVLLHSGVGRVVVFLDSGRVESLAQSPRWKGIVAHLWKVRANQTPSMLDRGVWRSDLDVVAQDRRAGGQNYQALYGYKANPMRNGGQLVQALMPASVRVIPFWVIVVILSLFTLAVGPGDYIVLGLLRQRKLTWIVFPCLAIAFTLVTVSVADRYMGRTDQRRSMIVSDIGADGRVLRQSTLELTFLAKEQTVKDEIAGAMALPISGERMSMDVDYQYQQRGMRGQGMVTEERRGGAPLIVGKMPDRYELQRRVYQWQPDLLRRTDIPLPDQPRAEPKHKITWPAASAYDRVADPQIVNGLPPGSSAATYYKGVYSQIGVVPLPAGLQGTGSRLSSDSFTELCVRRQEGLFSIVSQVSPTGSDTFEDVSLLDPTDGDQWLLVVIVPMGEDYHVYRRLYRTP